MVEILLEDIPKEIKTAMVAKGMDKRMVAKRSGVPYQTLCRRLREPGTMTVAELSNISCAVGIQWGVK